MRLEQQGTEFWAEIDENGSPLDWHVPAGTLGFAWASPISDLYGFFGEEQLALAELIAREDPGLIVWIA